MIAQGTGQALIPVSQDDVVFVHAKAAEEEFAAEGYGVERIEVMYNDYVVVDRRRAARVGAPKTW